MFAYSLFMRKLISLFVILLIGVLLTFAGCQSSRSAYKSATYVIVRSDGDFELRDNPVSPADRLLGIYYSQQGDCLLLPAVFR